ncbi:MULTISPECIES: multicopper oxidase family protein [unclassified Nitrobacter]|uniref:multicopper oxidase family protein n=1 Tax=unclassified Nitrobacter TaxID=2620411 RepID=UPI00092BEAC6|nr:MULTISPECIES: multicopper oxidase domain-containing protein [unclassified Nitrobacter]MBN9147290.1 multicopper oxidase domain-containing protein [Nitrobacter sp.]OJV03616.1 MAG: copper oxidase [Nitrobacter sp. 62-23]
MTRAPVHLTRRHLLAGIGLATAGPAAGLRAQQQRPQTLAIGAMPVPLRLGPNRDETAVWSLRTDHTPPLRFRQSEAVEVALHNGLPAPLVLNWHGIDGAPSIEPLTARRPALPGETDRFLLPLRQAGTFLCDARLLGDGLAQSSPAQALIVEERTPVEVDRDEVMLIEDWRLHAEGRPIAPGAGGKTVGAPLYLVNGKPSLDLTLRPNDRLRLRIINACQRNAIALGIQNLDVRVMAIDSQPAEPFLARNGRLVLAPGSRVDAVLDATPPAGTTSAVTLHDGGSPRQIARLHVSAEEPPRSAPLPTPAPLPSESLPARPDLKTALRVDVPLAAPGGTPTSWNVPTHFNMSSNPAFRVKRGRTVVLALTNPAAIPTAFHLHGHHFRLLDRLDDGWKPFWLDTVLVDAGQTQRIAFAADVAGAWLVETMAVEWSAPRQVQWFAVE